MKIKTLGKAKTFSRVMIREVGNHDADDDDRSLVGSTFAVWTELTSSSDELAPYELRGLVAEGGRELTWLPDDTVVDVVEKPRMLARPENLIDDAEGARERTRGLYSSGEIPQIIDDSDPVWAAVANTDDPEIAVHNLLLALSVAPDLPVVKDLMVAALAARFATVRRDKEAYPPNQYPWAKLAKR